MSRESQKITELTNTFKCLLKYCLCFTIFIGLCLIVHNIFIGPSKTIVSNSQQSDAGFSAKIILPQVEKDTSLPFLQCASNETCYSSNLATISTLSTALDHLDSTARYNYTIVVSKASIDSLANKTQNELPAICSTEKLCIIRNDVQKGTMLKDLKRIGEGEKSVFFKYSLNIQKQSKMI